MKGTFNLHAPSVEKLFDQPRVDLSFTGNRGILDNVDLMRAAQSSGRDGVRGGRTRFASLSGVVTVNGDRTSFQQVRIASESMNASGAFEVQPKGSLAGRLGIQVGPRGTVSAQGSVAVTGEVRNPVLR